MKATHFRIIQVSDLHGNSTIINSIAPEIAAATPTVYKENEFADRLGNGGAQDGACLTAS